MKIKEIYEKYYIAPNLRDHMLTVAKICAYIADNWTGESINKNTLVKCALVHDLGNIVKFNFDIHPEFWRTDNVDIGYWKEKQKEMISKYGEGDNEATKKILEEINFPQDLVELIYSKRFTKSIDTASSDNFILKILHYSDLRVLPLTIGSLEERLEEIKIRGNYNNVSNLEELFEACRLIEKQIQSNVKVPLDQINSESGETSDGELLNIEI